MSDLKTENWRRYAAWELVRQAVIDLRRDGDITGVTTQKMKRLFPEIQNGWDELHTLTHRPQERPEP